MAGNASRRIFDPRVLACAAACLLLGMTNGLAAGTATASSVAARAAGSEAATKTSSSPIIFDGWRRTVNGWERLPSVIHRPSINDRIASQRREEASNPLSQPLHWLGGVHPIRIAAAEIAIACLIAFLATQTSTASQPAADNLPIPLPQPVTVRGEAAQRAPRRGPRFDLPCGPQQTPIETIR